MQMHTASRSSVNCKTEGRKFFYPKNKTFGNLLVIYNYTGRLGSDFSLKRACCNYLPVRTVRPCQLTMTGLSVIIKSPYGYVEKALI